MQLTSEEVETVRRVVEYKTRNVAFVDEVRQQFWVEFLPQVARRYDPKRAKLTTFAAAIIPAAVRNVLRREMQQGFKFRSSKRWEGRRFGRYPLPGERVGVETIQNPYPSNQSARRAIRVESEKQKS